MTKYKAKRTKVMVPGHGEITFASKREAKRAVELALMEKAGKIKFLKFQPRYILEVNEVKVCDYVGDFEYYELGPAPSRFVSRDPVLYRVTEDVKGVKTPTYQIKKKLMKAILGIEIRET